MLSLLLSFVAAAQTPPAGASIAEVVWIVGDQPAPARRFLDQQPGDAGTVEPGTRATVLFREGELIRLRIGERYVWVDQATTSPTAPEGAEAERPAFDIDELLRMAGAAEE